MRSISHVNQALKKHTQAAHSAATLTTLEPLSGTRCIITGASRGIGQAIATTFAQKGARCLLIGRDEKALASTLAECIEKSNINPDLASRISFHATKLGDVSSRDFWTSLNLQELLPTKLVPDSEDGSLDDRIETLQQLYCPDKSGLVLVNAAGITHSSLLLTTSPSQIESVIQTNLMGTLWSSQILAKQMIRQKSGVIVNIASLLALHGGAGSAAYVASKSGVIGLTRALAAELGSRGVRVNAVLPGYIESDMTRAMSAKAREEALAKIPAGRFGTVDEVAEAAVFLASSTYANNCIINLDGGLSAV
ncbi:hypothetical protein BDV97DRAFT_197600 [Delphinella strobiligena]|nr:hypothetical protein BDV97DRAFT_197600 [Delphinella strobiligena]